MTVQTAAVLKSYFETGDKPDQGQFGDLIDTLFYLPPNQSYTAPYTGAMARLQSDKLQDVVHLRDFAPNGIVPSTNQGTFLNSVIASITSVTTPPILNLSGQKLVIETPILLRNNLSIIQTLGSCRLDPVANLGAHMFQLYDDNVRKVTLSGLRIEGNKANQTDSTKNIFNLVYGSAPGAHADINIFNTNVYNAKGIGFNYGLGIRDSYNQNCAAFGCDVFGMLMGSADMNVIGFNAGNSGQNGIRITAGGVRISSSKVFGSGKLDATNGNGYGIWVRTGDSDIEDGCLQNIWSQENPQGALLLSSTGTGSIISFTGDIESDTDGETIVKYGGRAINCHFDITASQTLATFTPTHMVEFNGPTAQGNSARLLKPDWTIFSSNPIHASGGAVYGDNEVLIQGNGKASAVTYAASYTPDPFVQNVMPITLTGDIAIANPVASRTLQPGLRMKFIFLQDSTGGRAVTFGTLYSTNWTPNTAAGKYNVIEFICNGTRWIQDSSATGL